MSDIAMIKSISNTVAKENIKKLAESGCIGSEQEIEVSWDSTKSTDGVPSFEEELVGGKTFKYIRISDLAPSSDELIGGVCILDDGSEPDETPITDDSIAYIGDDAFFVWWPYVRVVLKSPEGLNIPTGIYVTSELFEDDSVLFTVSLRWNTINKIDEKYLPAQSSINRIVLDTAISTDVGDSNFCGTTLSDEDSKKLDEAEQNEMPTIIKFKFDSGGMISINEVLFSKSWVVVDGKSQFMGFSFASDGSTLTLGHNTTGGGWAAQFMVTT